MTFGCQEDDEIEVENTSTNQPNFELQYYSWEHFKQRHKSLANKISSINQDAAFQRGASSSTYGFTIDETEVQVIAQEGFATYTFPVHRETEEMTVVENYVLKQFDDGTYQQYLLTYHY